MSALGLSRRQFGITAVHHFFLVTLGPGLSILVAARRPESFVKGDPACPRRTNVLGKLFLITFAAGVIKGIVLEFLFGMSWPACPASARFAVGQP